METILQLSRRLAHNSSPSSMDMKYSPTESLKLSARDNKRIERRKPNWTEAENVFLLDQFGLHREILTCKATDASTNLKKQEIWRVICQNLNTHNTLVRRTPAEVRRKWKNLVTAAKKEVWEMRHQIHLSGGSNGANGRKISELSQRVLQLHSSGGFSSGNPNGLYGTLLSAGLIGHPPGLSGISSDKYDKYDDKSYIPAHFTPIITLSESNNNHISLLGSSGDGPPSPLSEEDQDDQDDESSDSRNATEFMSDSGIYEQEGIDLRVNVSTRSGSGGSENAVNFVNGSRGGGSLNGNDTMNGGRHINHISRHLMKAQSQQNNSDPGDDEDDDVDCDVEDVEDMSLIRFANHMGQKLGKNNTNTGNHPLSTYISNALYNNHLGNNNNNNGGGNGRSISGASYNIAKQLQQLQSRQNDIDAPIAVRKNSENADINDVSGGSPTGNAFNSELVDATLKLRNHFIASLKESDLLTNLYRERLELQIEVLKLRKQKLNQELKPKRINGLLTLSTNSPKNRFPKILKDRRKNNSSNYFRLKPKNTWMNFAAKEKLLGLCKDTKESNSPNNDVTAQVIVNGINGSASDHENGTSN